TADGPGWACASRQYIVAPGGASDSRRRPGPRCARLRGRLLTRAPKASAPALLRFDVAVGFADCPAVLARPDPRLNSQRSPSAHSARTVAAKHEDEARRLRLRAGRPALRSSAPRRRCASRTQPPSWRRWWRACADALGRLPCTGRQADAAAALMRGRTGARCVASRSPAGNAAKPRRVAGGAGDLWGDEERRARGGRAGRRHARDPFTLSPRLFDRSEPQVSEGSFRGEPRA